MRTFAAGGVREHLFEMKVEDAEPEFPVQWLGGKRVPRPGADEQPPLPGVWLPGSGPRAGAASRTWVATTYWVDTTDADELRSGM